jgi:hypothetical protein
MSNSRISALTSASTPLTGSEVLPVVQSGTTTQVTVANLTAGRTVSAADFLAPIIGAGSGATLSIQANGTTYITVLGAGTNNGYVGFGTTTPASPVHVYSSNQGTPAAPTFQVGTNNSSLGFTQQVIAIYPNELDTDYLSAYNVGGGNNNGTSFVIANAGRSGTAGTVKFILGLDALNGATIAAAIGTASNHALAFGTNSSERARFDTSGNFLFGTTSSPGSSSHTAVGITGVFNNVSGNQSVAIATEYGGTITITSVQGGVGASTWVVPFINRSGTTAVSSSPTKAVYSSDPIGSVTASGANIVISATYANTYISYFIQYVPMAA